MNAPAGRNHTRRGNSWERTSPSSWTWRTSSMRQRPQAWTSITSRSSRSARPGAISCAPWLLLQMDPDSENQRNFATPPPRVPGRQQGHPANTGDGKVKANLDIELVVDMIEDHPEPRRRDRRVGRRRLLAPTHPGRPGDGCRVEVIQLPQQHQLRPDRGRRPVQRYHPARASRRAAQAGVTTMPICR